MSHKDWKTAFDNKFVYKAYGIVNGEGKEMEIRSQQDYTPLTHENVVSFIENLLAERDKELLTFIENINVSGGGNGRRLKEQILGFITSQE